MKSICILIIFFWGISSFALTQDEANAIAMSFVETQGEIENSELLSLVVSKIRNSDFADYADYMTEVAEVNPEVAGLQHPGISSSQSAYIAVGGGKTCLVSGTHHPVAGAWSGTTVLCKSLPR